MSNHQRTPRVSLFLLVAAAVTCLALPARVSAQGTSAAPGVRVGVSSSPDQFYFGAHYDTGYIFQYLSFRPNLEVGLGDNVTTVAANFEFAYWFPVRNQPFRFYVGGGPALNVYRYDLPVGTSTDAKPGFNLLGGVAHRNGLFVEVKVGLIDSPSAKFGIGYTWR